MRIAIYYDDSGSKGLDLSSPEHGNPGVGGTQFCFLMLMKYLAKVLKTGDELYAYHSNANDNIFSENVNMKYVPIEHLMETLSSDNIDVALVNVSRLKCLNQQIANSKTKFVIWVHNFLNKGLLQMLNGNHNIKRVVFVGKEQYDRYIDDELIKKSTCIVNMYNSSLPEYKRDKDLNPVVTYTGAIVKEKGFHALAKEWKAILKEVPNAQLYVIGGGNLYNRNAQMGQYGIATQDYENEFMPFLLDDNGDIMPSVHFCGILGKEKISIYQKTLVGVINPTARTEICPLSAIEMEGCGIPVISKNKNGMPDVIEHGKTGILVKSSKQLREAVVRLLTDKNLNVELGNNAKKYIGEKFSPEKLVCEWYSVFTEVMSETEAHYLPPTSNYNNNYKYLRIANRVVKNSLKLSFIPSLASLECIIKDIIRK